MKASKLKIYLIRHAKIEIDKPGWGGTKKAENYKLAYNQADIHVFNPTSVLNRIDQPYEIDTVFCSTQSRAIQTAKMLFDERVILKIDSNLRELDYPVRQIPILRLPVNAWLAIFRISWMNGNNKGTHQSYSERILKLEIFAEEIIKYAEENGKSVIIAHGMINRELIKILKNKGWQLEQRDGLGNLSVNCLIK